MRKGLAGGSGCPTAVTTIADPESATKIMSEVLMFDEKYSLRGRFLSGTHSVKDRRNQVIIWALLLTSCIDTLP
jgi:hypothetical protein